MMALGTQAESSAKREFSAIVIGASAGGIDAISTVMSFLSADCRLPVLIVQHVHPADKGGIAALLNQRLDMEVCEPHDKDGIQPGHVYIAPANYHMLVERPGAIALSVDSKVHWSRPSIDVLFESAARVWKHQLIGVILSGANRDGAAGMRMMGERGAVLFAQEPATAERPEMPVAAIEEANIKKILSPQDIGASLLALAEPSGSENRKGEVLK